jgi:hypothetical protein
MPMLKKFSLDEERKLNGDKKLLLSGTLGALKNLNFILKLERVQEQWILEKNYPVEIYLII